jgi:hypothetical protein
VREMLCVVVVGGVLVVLVVVVVFVVYTVQYRAIFEQTGLCNVGC